MLFDHVSRELGVWMGVGCPCPPVRNDIVTLRSPKSLVSILSIRQLHYKRHQFAQALEKALY